MHGNMDEMLNRVREYVFETDEALKESMRSISRDGSAQQHETAALKQIRYGVGAVAYDVDFMQVHCLTIIALVLLQGRHLGAGGQGQGSKVGNLPNRAGGCQPGPLLFTELGHRQCCLGCVLHARMSRHGLHGQLSLLSTDTLVPTTEHGYRSSCFSRQHPARTLNLS